jgi:16S rRNA (uracil1498-N3)-methyltransferase
MSQRYFVETPIGDSPTAQLVDAEAQHLAKVMRARIGDEITLFDGSGREFTARVASLERAAVRCEHLMARAVDRELKFQLRLGIVLPKGDRQRWLVEKLTELGVTCLIPLVSSHSAFRPESSTLIRLRRSVIESSKQCGRNRLMEIAEPKSWADFVGDSPVDSLRLLAHPTSASADCRGGPVPARADRDVVIAVGPEGGFTDEEVEFAVRAGWQKIDLGPRIVRIETAAITAAALFAVQ